MAYPAIIPLKAQLDDHSVQIWWLGKWRTIAYYPLNRTPSAKLQAGYIEKFKLAAGLKPEQKCELNWQTPEK